MQAPSFRGNGRSGRSCFAVDVGEAARETVTAKMHSALSLSVRYPATQLPAKIMDDALKVIAASTASIVPAG